MDKAASWQWRRWGVALAALVGICLAMAMTLALPDVSERLKSGLTRQYPAREAEAYPQADAIVVLGGGVAPRATFDWGEDDPRVQETRLGFGVELLRAGRAPRIVLSGGKGEALAMAASLRKQRISMDEVSLETASLTTHENATHTAALLRSLGVHRILLVTSTQHMPRALPTFRRMGLDVVPASAFDPPERAPVTRWPSRASFNRSMRYLREYVGLLAYRAQGWA